MAAPYPDLATVAINRRALPLLTLPGLVVALAMAGAWLAADLIRGGASVGGDPKRFLSSTGELRLRVTATQTASFRLNTDLMTFTATNQP